MSKTSPSSMVLACEATGKLLSFGSEAGIPFLAGKSRAFCNEEVATAHMKIEKQRGALWLHRDCIWADPSRLITRFGASTASFESLVVQVRDRGFVRPLLVRRSLAHTPATYELRAGFRLWQVAQRLRIMHVAAQVVDFGISPLVDSLLERLTVEELPPIEFAQALQQLLSEGIESTPDHKTVPQREIASWLGISQSRISDLLALLHSLHPQVRDALAKGTINFAKASIIKQLPKHAQVEVLDRAAEWNSRALRRYVGNVRLGLVGEPRHASKKGRRMRVAGRPVRLRTPREVAKALVEYEDRFFSGDLGVEAGVRALQYTLSIIRSLESDLVLPADVLEDVQIEAVQPGLTSPQLVRPRAMPITIKLPALRRRS